jgi:hypothetical protein
VDKKNVYRKDMLFFITCLQDRTAVDGIWLVRTDWWLPSVERDILCTTVPSQVAGTDSVGHSVRN